MVNSMNAGYMCDTQNDRHLHFNTLVHLCNYYDVMHSHRLGLMN